MNDDPAVGRSDLREGTITDNFATEVRRLGTLIVSNDRAAIIIFGIIILAVVVTSALQGASLLAGLIMLFGLIFYQMLSDKNLRRERLEIERERQKLLAGASSAQLKLMLSGVDSASPNEDGNRG